jgi:hypothetical protein
VLEWVGVYSKKKSNIMLIFMMLPIGALISVLVVQIKGL